VRRDLGLALALQALAALGVALVTGWGWLYVAKASMAMAAAVAWVAWGFARQAGAPRPAACLGAANRVTLVRVGLAMLLAAAVDEPVAASPSWVAWALVGVASVAALLDAVDGPLARRSGRASAFGARFDMESDAWLTLVLSVLVWQAERAGAWVLASGLMRYAFVAATWGWPWLAMPLAPRRRRQAVCVIQIVALIVALAPVGPPAWSGALCAAGLVLLAASFGADVRLLWRARGIAGSAASISAGAGLGWRPAAGWLVRFAAATFVLNTLLTFESRMDGIGVHWSPRLSFELCVGMLVLLAWVSWRGVPARRAQWGLAALCTLFALMRYVDVTVPAFFGRPVNLYWDAPHAWQLARLAWATWPAWQVLGAALAVATALGVILAAARWALATLAGCVQVRPVRPWLAVGGALLCTSFAAYPFVAVDTRWFFSLPVTPTLARQAQLLGQALSRERTEARLTPSPAFAGNLAGLHGADVLLLFAESYGASTLDRPAQAAALIAPRERLAHALQRGGRQVVSARVRSPTFGGGSWLAHAALLSGVDTRDPGDYDLLLTTRRPTLVSHFARHGYRTVGWMPGMQRPWPEVVFYGFERYADAQGVGYTGPGFGYWRIPDQASIALLHAQELGVASPPGATRAPRFVVFPTLETHAPFHPIAPYQKQWAQLLTQHAYTPEQLAEALAPTGPPGGWAPAYVSAVRHTFEWLGDYLAGQAPRHLVTIVIGDHQPLAAVSGAGASWDVPVHVISDDEALLQRLREAGFVSGLLPGPRTLGAMHELTDLLVRVFNVPGVDVAGSGPRRE
jgi:phosphatidylglycerophosphate synthase